MSLGHGAVCALNKYPGSYPENDVCAVCRRAEVGGEGQQFVYSQLLQFARRISLQDWYLGITIPYVDTRSRDHS